MVALVTFVLIVLASTIVTRVATVALSMTGLSTESARFQARSALSGAGFTTRESESITNHPVRRRVVMTLMLLGSAGLVTAIATLSISFVGQDGDTGATRLAILAAALLVMVLVLRSAAVDRGLSRLFALLLRRFTDLDVSDYSALLHLSEGHAVAEVPVATGDWLCSHTLAELDLRGEGLAVLGIDRVSGDYVGAPHGSTEVLPGDTLVMYGPRDAVATIGMRPAGPDGDRAHRAAAAAHRPGG